MKICIIAFDKKKYRNNEPETSDIDDLMRVGANSME